MPVQSTHPQYDAMSPKWQRCRDVYEGEDAVKARGGAYLPVPGGQSAMDGEYLSYKARAMFFNGLRPTVEGFTGLLLRQAPKITIPETLAPHASDITLDDTPLDDFVLRALEEQLVVSRLGLLLDYSEGRKRPYWVSYRAEQVLNWRVGRVRDAMSLTRVVLMEDVEVADPKDEWAVRHVPQVRVLDLVPSHQDGTPPDLERWTYTVRLFRPAVVEGKADTFEPVGDPRTPMRRGQPLDFLPFVILGPGGIEVDVARPVLLDLVNVNLSHYRSSADLEHGRHWTASPTPWATGVPAQTTELRIGSATAWILEAGGQAGYLEYRGQGLGSLKDALEEKKALMASLGAKLLESQPSKAETAEAVRLRHTGEHARLQTLAMSASLALSSLLRWHVWWAGLDNVKPEEAQVAVNQSFFEIRMTPEEVKALVLSWTAGIISKRTAYDQYQRGGWARTDVSFEQEEEAINAEAPGVQEPAA